MLEEMKKTQYSLLLAHLTKAGLSKQSQLKKL